MDLNELLQARQLEVMNAKALGKGEARESHYQNVADYAQRVRAVRNISAADPTVASSASRETIIYGTYEGDPAGPPAGAFGESGVSDENLDLSENRDRGHSND